MYSLVGGGGGGGINIVPISGLSLSSSCSLPLVRFRHRSLSLEHLDISGKDKGRPGSSDVSNTSPSLVRTWSKVGNKKNMEQDSESTGEDCVQYGGSMRGTWGRADCWLLVM